MLVAQGAIHLHEPFSVGNGQRFSRNDVCTRHCANSAEGTCGTAHYGGVTLDVSCQGEI